MWSNRLRACFVDRYYSVVSSKLTRFPTLVTLCQIKLNLVNTNK